MANPRTLTNSSLDYFIDVNVTALKNTVMLIHNGTFMARAANATEVEFDF